MLTRRENLLIRPWQERRYIHHRQKVKSALPAIDTSPPPLREHVNCKLKKMQKENERCSQIIEDNFTLLQHLSNIMSTTRVDHFWEDKPPNFLQRVGVYASGPIKSITDSDLESRDEDQPPGRTRKEKCAACSPERHKKKIVYDVRRPYTPPKPRLSRKQELPLDTSDQHKSRCDEDRLEFRGKVWRSPTRPQRKKKTKKSTERLNPFCGESQSLVLTRAGLRVAVEFSSSTDVTFTTNTESKVIQRKLCECKAFPRINTHKKK